MGIEEELPYGIKRIDEENDASYAFPSSSHCVEKLPFGRPDPYPGAAPEPADAPSD